MKRLFLTLLLFSPMAWADDSTMKEGMNYCHDQEATQSIEKFFTDAPNDPLVIRLVALRRGLCEMVDDKKISLAQAIDIFNDEKNRAMVERSKEELMRKPRTAL